MRCARVSRLSPVCSCRLSRLFCCVKHHSPCLLATPLFPYMRLLTHEPKRQEGDPGQANADRQTLEDSGEIDEKRILGKAYSCKNKGHQHTEASKDCIDCPSTLAPCSKSATEHKASGWYTNKE